MKTKDGKSNLESGFDDMMNVALEYEFLKRQKKPIPDELQERLDKAFKGGLWVLGRIGHITTSMRTLKMEKWSLFTHLHTVV